MSSRAFKKLSLGDIDSSPPSIFPAMISRWRAPMLSNPSEVMGEEFRYSLKQGCARRSLETLMEYQVQQGILDRKPKIEDLFVPELLD